MVGVPLHDGAAAMLGGALALAELVLTRGFVLLIGTVASVKGGSHHGSGSVRGRRFSPSAMHCRAARCASIRITTRSSSVTVAAVADTAPFGRRTGDGENSTRVDFGAMLRRS